MLVRFSSTIHILSKDEFKKMAAPMKKLLNRKEYTDEKDGIDKRVKLQKRGCTEYAYDCNAGGVQNGKRVTLFHLFPPRAVNEIPKLKQQLEQDIVKLTQKGSIRALITGGRAFQDNDRYKPSKKLFKALVKILKNAGVKNLSIIWGRTSSENNGATNLIYDSNKDTWYINAGYDYWRQKFVETEKELREVFKIVKIAPGDTLKFS